MITEAPDEEAKLAGLFKQLDKQMDSIIKSSQLKSLRQTIKQIDDIVANFGNKISDVNDNEEELEEIIRGYADELDDRIEEFKRKVSNI